MTKKILFITAAIMVAISVLGGIVLAFSQSTAAGLSALFCVGFALFFVTLLSL